jgi:hypothetical protein
MASRAGDFDRLASAQRAGILGRMFASYHALPPAGSVEPAVPQASTLPRGGGVCALTSADHRIVQLLATGSIRRAVASRLHPPEPSATSKRPDLRSVVTAVWWQPGYSAFERDWLHLLRARQLYPHDYAQRFSLAPVWYARINLAEPFPRWQPTTRLAAGDGVTVGPFSTRKRCAELIGDLEDLFDLCRYHDVLVRAPHGERCAYYDMGKCPAPCDGTVSMAAYRAALAASADFAVGKSQAMIDANRQAMTQAAARQDFEQAQRCKGRLARAEQAVRRFGGHPRTPDALDYCVVQRGPRRGVLRLFQVRSGIISGWVDAQPADRGDFSVICGALAVPSDKPCDAGPHYRGECIAILWRHLQRTGAGSGVYLNLRGAEDGGKLAERIAACFSRSS